MSEKPSLFTIVPQEEEEDEEEIDYLGLDSPKATKPSKDEEKGKSALPVKKEKRKKNRMQAQELGLVEACEIGLLETVEQLLNEGASVLHRNYVNIRPSLPSLPAGFSFCTQLDTLFFFFACSVYL